MKENKNAPINKTITGEESNTKQDHQSHIQLPKLLLRRFETENPKGFLAYYDVQKKIIGTNGHAKSLNTQKNYYSNEAERYWNNEVEGALRKLLDALDEVDTDRPRSTLPSNFDSLAKKYLHSLIARSPRAHKKTEESSIYLQFVDEQYHHDISSTTMYALAQEQENFKEWILTLLVNKTAIPFLLPMCGYIEYGFKNTEGYIAMPVDPHKAILLVPPEARNLYCEEDHIKYGLIESDAMIKKINQFAIETQIGQNYGYVISNNREILTEAVELFNQSEKENKRATAQDITNYVQYQWKTKELSVLLEQFEDNLENASNDIKDDDHYKMIMLHTTGRCLNLMREIIILCEAGYPDGAFALARSLFEQFVHLYFFKAYEQKPGFNDCVEDYWLNGQYQIYKYNVECAEILSHKDKANLHKEYEEMKAKSKHCFPGEKQRSNDYWWADKNSFNGLFKTVRDSSHDSSEKEILNKLHLFYTATNRTLHANAAGSRQRLGRLDNPFHVIDTAPDVEGQGYPLYFATQCMALVMNRDYQIFQMNCQQYIKELYALRDYYFNAIHLIERKYNDVSLK